MSSNNRNRRPSQSQPDHSDDTYEDDVIFEDSFQLDDDWVDDGSYTSPSSLRHSESQRSRSSGTASQLDQLRRSIGRPQSSPQSTSRVPAASSGQNWEEEAEAFYGNDEYGEETSYERTPAPQTRPRRTSQPLARSRQRAAAAQPVEVYEDEDETYAPYEEYEDDFSEYDAPRAPARTPRPRPQVSMPSIKMPAAISQAELVSDLPSLSLIGASVASLAAMAILVANQSSSLAPEFATHVSASGILENFASESAIWQLPLLATAFTLMNVVIAWFVAGLDRFASRFILMGALLVQLVVWVALIRIL